MGLAEHQRDEGMDLQVLMGEVTKAKLAVA